jgi:hypothetical protein
VKWAMKNPEVLEVVVGIVNSKKKPAGQDQPAADPK